MLDRYLSRLKSFHLTNTLEYALLIGITLIALLPRFYKLGEWSFWIDEISYLNRVQAHYRNLEIALQFIPPAQKWFPVSLIMSSRAINVWGVNEWSARFVPAIFGVITIPAIYFPTKRLFGSTVGLIAALLIAISPWHIFWSQNARYFTPLTFFYTMALFAIYFGLEQDRPFLILVSALLLYLALSERLNAFFLVPVVIAYLVFLKVLGMKSPPGYRWQILLLLLSLGIAFTAYEVYSFITSGTSIFLYAIDVFAGNVIDSPARILILIIFDIGVPLFVIAVFSGVYLIVNKSRAGLFFFCASVVPLLLLVVLNSFFFTVDRYVFLTLPSWIILGAVGVYELVNKINDYGKILAVSLIIILVADAAVSNLMYYQLNNGNRLDWRGAVSFVKERKSDGDIVVATRGMLGEYYLGEKVVDWKDFDPALYKKQNNRIWFIVDSEGVWHGLKADAKQKWLQQNSQLLQFWYLRVRENINLQILLSDPPTSQ